MSQMATVTVSKQVIDHAASATCSLWPSDTMAKPLHIQHVEEALKLEPLLSYVEALNKQSIHSDQELSTDAETETDNESPMLMDRIRYHKDAEGNRVYDGVVISRAERKGDKCRLYNFSRVKKNRKWLKNVLLSDTSSEEDDDDDDVPVTEDELKQMLKEHVQMKRYQKHYQRSKDLRRYQYYSVGLLSSHDMFYDHQKSFTGPVCKKPPVKNKHEKEPTVKENTPVADSKEDEDQLEDDPTKLSGSQSLNGVTSSGGKPNGKVKVKKLTPEQLAARRRRLWVMIAKKEISRAQKQKAAVRKELLACIKKVAKECRKECRRSALLSQKTMKDAATRARRLSKEMQAYWKRFGKVEKEHRRKAEKEALEQRKIDMELREMKRQQRKLNFLITQTELYAHFMARKLTGGTDADRDAILQNFDEPLPANSQQNMLTGAALHSSADDDDYDVEEVKALALSNAEEAYKSHVCQKQAFDAGLHQSLNQRDPNAGESVFANPSISTAAEQPQPTIFTGKLKGYQLKGMNWLANLYDQGINGILADEMGLGKTVQSIAFLAHLAETQGTWGPFLVIAPASTLHNWQQEFTRFVPQFKVIPYWGNTQDRKILRKFWNPDSFSSKDSSFHIVITSYQLVVQDIKYFQRIKWHYMILDEAQAIKSSSSARWKILLSFNCRNRLLLTGTPIQNSMGELWALLHFIMPTMFDCHEEFNEWFSKDIESHVEKQSGLNESQLSRLHMILKPFMLRRVKKDVENELSDKIEVLVYCPLTLRQKFLYQAIKNKISIDDLLLSSTMSTMSQSASSSTSSLMNLVMQFRKVCNHPELFERREVRSAFFMRLPMYCLPKLIYRDGVLDNALPSKRHLLYNKLSIFTSHNIHQSLQKNADAYTPWNCFSFSRFINLSPSELEQLMLFGLCVRWLAVLRHLNKSHILCHRRQFQTEQDGSCFMNQSGFLLDNDRVLSSPNIKSSNVLGELVFCRKLGTMYAHLDHVIESMPETKEHRNMRLRHIKHNHALPGVASPSKAHMHHHHHVHSSDVLTFQHTERPSVILPCQPTDIPAFLHYNINKISARYRDYYCCDRSAAWQHDSASRCGSDEARTCLLYGAGSVAEVDWQCSRRHFSPSDIGGLSAVSPKHGYSAISIPDKETLVADAGKLSVLDKLLSRLKAEDHRVLIYSQMTRMIDILEEYLWHRKHSYIRLDGSSKIADRRDMVADFQSRSDIFVFLLSTRAGGLGINLTAADTVIFYDSDWNPTVDQQAMDRAHRLGQTKQVTVYRLICRGTIEERIVERAREKSEIQRMVISGGNFAPDILKPKEVVSLLLDDDEMQKKFQLRQEEKRQKELFSKEKDSERKRQLKSDKPKSGRGPGRRPKLAKSDIETNVTIPAPVDDCTIGSIGTLSTPASPYSEMSLVSEGTQLSASIATDDESIDSLVIVDDIQGPSLHGTNPLTTTTIVKRGSGRGRGRGRPRGSGVGLRSRGPSSIQRSLVAAEEAAATAAKTAAYAAYGYSFNDQNVVSNSATLSSSSSADCVASGSLTGSRQQLMRRTLSNGSLPRGSHKSSTRR